MPGEVVEVLQEDRRLDELLERASRPPRESPRRFANTCSVCGLMSPGRGLLLARTQRELARDEDEAVRLDRLRVRSALERGRCCFGANDLLRHGPPPRLLNGPKRLAERGADRLEDRCEHVLRVGALDEPHVQVQPGRDARARSRKREATSVASPPTRSIGEVDVRDEPRLVAPARATPARAPRRPGRATSPGHAARGEPRSRTRRPSVRPAAVTPSSALPGCHLERRRGSVPPARARVTRWSSTGRPVSMPPAPSSPRVMRASLCVSLTG